MKILITGGRGMLGQDLKTILESKNVEVISADLGDFDICDQKAVLNFIKNTNPDAVIHCAAYTNVDGCEDNVETAFKVNGCGTRNIALSCGKFNKKMVYISTDYIFDGTKNSPYYEYDTPNPLSIYGMSKFYGEKYVSQLCTDSFIVRISWLFGPNGNNFVKAILKKAVETGEISVVTDQHGSPTYTKDLALFLNDLVATEHFGIYHATNEGYCTWFDFAKKAIELNNLSEKVKMNQITADILKRRAIRPKNSMLHKINLKTSGFTPLPTWETALKRYIDETFS
ncbi:MAG: dTDP-4-dehydrorhamnose reductase [Candidatus Wallbacteria bacterium]